jgi:RNA polymerase sigma-70 factor (ECF subfamily)
MNSFASSIAEPESEAYRFQADKELVERAVSGDADAFATLFQTHRGRVYAVCLRMTNNVTEAEDLTQDAFMQVFRKLSTFRGESSLSTWLYRLAVNTILMHFRQRAPKAVSMDDEIECYDKPPIPRYEFGRPDGHLRSAVERIALMRALETLPDGYRRIFELHEIEGYAHREIARLLHCSIGNSKSQLHKARQRIQKLLHTSRRTSVALPARQEKIQGTPLVVMDFQPSVSHADAVAI